MSRRKQFRAVATRFDKLAVRYQATIAIADIFIWLRARPDRSRGDPRNTPLGARWPRGRCPELSTRADAELHVDLAEMPFDGAGAQEELCSDLRIRETIARESDNLLFLGGELVACLSTALSDGLARRDQLSARALGERLHSDGGKHVVRRTKLLACAASSPLAPQPLPVEQMRAGELGT